MIISSVFATALTAGSAFADHSPNFPWPWKLDDSNPFSTLTMNGLHLSVLQGFPTFNNGVDKVKGSLQYGNKNSLYMGMQLWEGASVYANPEMWYGYNPSNNISVASSVNVALPKVESSSPYIQLQRLFLRQVINLDGDKTRQEVSGGRSIALETIVNKLSTETSKNNLTVILGKFGVGDVFDDNIYAHDPTKHFMSMSFVGMNSVDWVGNAWSTSIGGALEWTHDWWTARAGIFQGSEVPPSNNLEPVPLKQYMAIGEFEVRTNFFNQPGSYKLIGYQDHGYINQIGEYTGVATVYDYLPYFVKENMKRRTKLGLSINVQQQIMDGVGFFMRGGIDNKTLAIDDVTQSLNGGLVVNGKFWDRKDDEFGIAAGVNSQSYAKTFLNAELNEIGLGTKKFGSEINFESYYRFSLNKNVEFTVDYQFVKNPLFIKNSGPAHIFGLRLRANF